MANDLYDLSLSTTADLSIQAVEKIKTTTNKLPSPALVANAVSPEVLLVKWRKCGGCITNEAVGSMRVHAEQERDKQVMRVPEGFE